jgi:hypothetical protein
MTATISPFRPRAIENTSSVRASQHEVACALAPVTTLNTYRHMHRPAFDPLKPYLLSFSGTQGTFYRRFEYHDVAMLMASLAERLGFTVHVEEGTTR